MARKRGRDHPGEGPSPGGAAPSGRSTGGSRDVESESIQTLLEQLRETNQRLVIAGVREQELADRAEREAAQMNALLQNLAEGVAIFDATGRIVLMNQAGRRILSLSEQHHPGTLEELGGLDFRRPDGDPLPFEERPMSRARRGEQFSNEEVAWVRPEGAIRRLAFSGSSLRDDRGDVVLAVSVFRDITEQRLQEKTREEYVALISHDLRSPLTAIMGQASWLNRLLKGKGLEREAAAAGSILTGAKRMNAMIQDLVESAHLESGQMEMRRQATDLPLLVADLAGRVGTAEDRARIHLESPEWVTPPHIDPERIERVLTNLITNALKYSAPETPVVVGVERVGDQVLVSVKDQGEGIAPEDMAHLFGRFYRARAGKEVHGLGLGLYIARLIVEAHGGRIWATSQIGVGSTFCFTLPMSSP